MASSSEAGSSGKTPEPIYVCKNFTSLFDPTYGIYGNTRTVLIQAGRRYNDRDYNILIYSPNDDGIISKQTRVVTLHEGKWYKLLHGGDKTSTPYLGKPRPDLDQYNQGPPTIETGRSTPEDTKDDEKPSSPDEPTDFDNSIQNSPIHHPTSLLTTTPSPLTPKGNPSPPRSSQGTSPSRSGTNPLGTKQPRLTTMAS